MEEDWEIEDENSWIAWLKKNWETIALCLIIGSLLIISLCSLIQLIITLRK